MRLTQGLIFSLGVLLLAGCSVPKPAKYTNPLFLENVYVESLNEAALPSHDFNVTYQHGRNADGRRSNSASRLEITFPLGFVNTHNRISQVDTLFLGSMVCGTASQLATQDYDKKVTCRTTPNSPVLMANSNSASDLFFSAACLGREVGACDEVVLTVASGNSREGSTIRRQHGRAIHLVRQVNTATSQIAYTFLPTVSELSRQRQMSLNDAIDAARNVNQ